MVRAGQESSGRRKTRTYFATDKQKLKDERETEEVPVKRKTQNDNDESVKSTPSKKLRKVDDGDDDDFVPPTAKKNSAVTTGKKFKSGLGKGVAQTSIVDVNEVDEDDVKNTESPLKSNERGHGGRGVSGAPAGGRGGFMNFGERKDPPHKGEKEVPEGAPDFLVGLTFVISGTLDSLEREEAEDLIKRHGGRVTGSIIKKTNYLLCDVDNGGAKSKKAKDLGTAFLTGDGLFAMFRASNHGKTHAQGESKKSEEKVSTSLPKQSPQKTEVKSNSSATKVARKIMTSVSSPVKRKYQNIRHSSLPWTEKYRPKAPNEIVGNQSLVRRFEIEKREPRILGWIAASSVLAEHIPQSRRNKLAEGKWSISTTLIRRDISHRLDETNPWELDDFVARPGSADIKPPCRRSNLFGYGRIVPRPCAARHVPP